MTFPRLCISLFFILLVPSIVSAQVVDIYVVLGVDTRGGVEITSIDVVKDDFYHRDYLFTTQFGPTGKTLLFENADGVYLVREPLLEHGNIIDYLDLRRASKVSILEEDSVVFEMSLSFCDYDRVCEPCVGPGCASAENSLICSDCPTGAEDNYCDLVNDSVCDPDCAGDEADCPDCAPYCFYDGMPDPLFCESDMGGEICVEGDVCVGDRLTVSTFDADGGSSCCAGDARCVSSVAYDVPAEVFEDGYGEDVLSYDELLDMEVEYREAEGMGFDEEFLSDAERDELYGKQYGVEIEDPLVMGDEEWREVIDDTESFPGHEEAPPSFTEQVVGKIDDLKGSVPDEASPLLIGFVAALVMLLLAALVVFFTHSSHKRLGREAVAPRVQREIAQLLRRGYDYNQARTVLLNKGYDLITVNAELTKHYQQTRLQYGKR